MSTPDLGISTFEKIEDLLRDEGIYMQRTEHRDPTKGGKPAMYPPYFEDVIATVCDFYTSARAAFTELHSSDGTLWNFMRRIVVETVPNRPDLHLPESPPHRTWYHHTRARRLRRGIAEYQERHRAHAADIAAETALCDEQGGGSPTHPAKSRMIYGDGKVIKPLFNSVLGDTREVVTVDPTTGEITIEQRQKRFDPDAKTHVQGDRRSVVGNKFAHIEVRGDDPHSRVILDVEHVPDDAGKHNSEADRLVEMILDVTTKLPGTQGVITDGVLRGVHLDLLQRERGLVIINPVHAKRVDPETGARTEKESLLGHEVFEYDDGATEEVPIWTVGGRLCAEIFTSDGESQFVALVRTATRIVPNADGSFRSYVEHAVLDPRTGERRIRRDRTDGPSLQHPDRPHWQAENIRQVPTGDPDEVRIYGRREDAESVNRGIDDALYLRRARSVGALRQLYDLIAHARGVNAVTRALHRKRQHASNVEAA